MRTDENDQPALRVLFAGTPEFAAQHLSALINSRCAVVGAYSQPDKRVGRGKKLTPTPVKALALEHNIPVFQPESLKNPAAQAELAELGADVMVVVAYGMLLPQAVLDIPRLGCINVHASLLPRWRGAAPIERAIEAGDTKSGVTIMQMDAGLDTGDMLCRVSCPIDSLETGDSLREKLAVLGTRSLVATLDQMASAHHQGTPQDNALSTYATKLEKVEAALDWCQPADIIDAKIRAFHSALVPYGMLGGERIKVWAASVERANPSAAPGTIVRADKSGITVACGEGSLRVTTLQLAGGKALDAQAVLNSRRAHFAPGQQFEVGDCGRES